MRYKAIFRDGSQYSLFGSEYFSDKPVFWRDHQSNLIGFCIEVCKKGRPVQIIDGDSEIDFKSESEFDYWYKRNQSEHIDFGFSDLTDHQTILDEAKIRIDKLLQFLKVELEELKTRPFDHWKYDGGYKELDQLCSLGVTSIEKIKSIMGINDELCLIKGCFEMPSKRTIGEHTIFTYRKIAHEKIEPGKLIEFCEVLINEIEKNTNSNIN